LIITHIFLLTFEFPPLRRQQPQLAGLLSPWISTRAPIPRPTALRQRIIIKRTFPQLTIFSSDK
jgi:hypothetical protein